MAENSSIEWTDATWTPTKVRRTDNDKVGWHCEKVSPGCKECYAETFNGRRLPNGGTGLPYSRRSLDFIEPFLCEETLLKPLTWRKPKRIFVCSMTDLFGSWVPDSHIDRVFAVMALASQHTFQVLTKRPERMQKYLDKKWSSNGGWTREMVIGANCCDLKSVSHSRWNEFVHVGKNWPLPNVWLGTSVENQAAADERIPHLLKVPAAARFLSMEPLLGHVDITYPPSIYPGGPQFCCSGHECNCMGMPIDPPPWLYPPENRIDWVIVGGESGPGARPCDLSWVRSIIDQCKSAYVPVFCKQLGAMPGETNPTGESVRAWGETKVLKADDGVRYLLKDKKGGDWDEWSEEFRVREFPKGGVS